MREVLDRAAALWLHAVLDIAVVDGAGLGALPVLKRASRLDGAALLDDAALSVALM